MEACTESPPPGFSVLALMFTIAVAGARIRDPAGNPAEKQANFKQQALGEEHRWTSINRPRGPSGFPSSWSAETPPGRTHARKKPLLLPHPQGAGVVPNGFLFPCWSRINSNKART
jgi:hypothetical protein